jgi:6,7-dimethyl-8-ribityllumazine synthase
MKPIAFVQACWHRDLVDGCRVGFITALAELELRRQVEVFEVPGSFEIPMHARLLANTGRFDAVAAAGLVVDGGIYRHEFVAQAVIDGLMRVQLETDVPVFSAVLTPQRFHDHETHQRFFAKHLFEKGTELANAVHQTLAARQAIVAA